MSDDSIVRTATPVSPPVTASEATAPTPITEGGSGHDTHIDTLLATYADDQGKPYVANYLEIEDVWKRQPELKLEVETIEGYLRKLVSEGKLDNSTRAAAKYLKEMEKKAGSNPYDSANQRIAKLLAYIDFKKVVDS